MKTRLFLNLSLLAVLVASCAPAVVTEAPAQSAPPVVVAPSVTPLAEAVAPTLEVAPTQASAPTALPIATSRGPELHATDPSTVSLASGDLHFVEFFRFT